MANPSMCPVAGDPELPAAPGRENKHWQRLCAGSISLGAPGWPRGQRGFHVGDGRAVGRLCCILRGDSLELLTLLLGFLGFFSFLWSARVLKGKRKETAVQTL